MAANLNRLNPFMNQVYFYKKKETHDGRQS